MNRKTSKLIRGFCKLTDKPFRIFKRAYDSMSPTEQRETKLQLQKFWAENEKAGLLNHRKYYDLKKPLPQDAAYTQKLLQAVRDSNTETATV
jgi:hypothetical protein